MTKHRLIRDLDLPGKSRRPALINVFVGVNVLLYVMVNVHLPLRFYPRGAHDDGLFMQHAKTIVAGHWLGLYSQMTLMKGSGYPIFLAAAHILGMSAVFAHAVFYCMAVAYLSWAILRYTRSRAFALSVFLLTLWNFGPDTSRIIRDSIVTPLYLIMLAGLVLGLLVHEGKQRRLHLIIAGGAFGFFWITREDAFVLAVTVALLFLAGLLRQRTATPAGLGFMGRNRAVAVEVILFLAAASAVILVPSTINFAKYRYFGVVDIKGDFESALESLQSIKSGPPVPYVPVPRASRELAYSVSPTFAQLKDPLDDPSSPLQGWKEVGCQALPQACGEYGGGWFQWALRDAVAMRGGYRDARTSAAFYRSIRAEIRAACAAKRIDCYRTIIPFMPRVSGRQLAAIPGAFAEGLAKLTFYVEPMPRTPLYLGTPEQFSEYGSFLNLDIQPPAEGQAPARSPDKSVRRAIKIYDRMVAIYHRTMPVLIGLGFLGFLVLTFRTIRDSSRWSGYVFLLGLWLTVFARTLLLALVDISSFSAMHHLYLSYAFPLIGLASAWSLYVNFTANTATRDAVQAVASSHTVAVREEGFRTAV